MNQNHRKPLPNSGLDYFDTFEAIEAIKPGAYAGLPTPQGTGRKSGAALRPGTSHGRTNANYRAQA